MRSVSVSSTSIAADLVGTQPRRKRGLTRNSAPLGKLRFVAPGAAHHPDGMEAERTGPQDDRRLTLEQVVYIVVFLIAVFLRTYELGVRPYHHDESIHAFFSWRILENGLGDYKYDPVYHGPLLYYSSALMMWLFGDSDFTGRLSAVRVRPRRARLRLAAAPLSGPLGRAVVPAAGDLLAELDVLHPLHPPRHLPGALQPGGDLSSPSATARRATRIPLHRRRRASPSPSPTRRTCTS